MKLAEIIALIGAVLGLAGALEGFFTVSFFTKLVWLAVVGGLAFWIAARWLTDWTKVRSPIGLVVNSPSRSYTKLAAAILALSIICFCFLVGTWAVLWFYAINIEVAVIPSDRVDFWIHGSRQVASKLTILVPPGGEFDCEPIGDSGHRAQTVINHGRGRSAYKRTVG